MPVSRGEPPHSLATSSNTEAQCVVNFGISETDCRKPCETREKAEAPPSVVELSGSHEAVSGTQPRLFKWLSNWTRRSHSGPIPPAATTAPLSLEEVYRGVRGNGPWLRKQAQTQRAV